MLFVFAGVTARSNRNGVQVDTAVCDVLRRGAWIDMPPRAIGIADQDQHRFGSRVFLRLGIYPTQAIHERATDVAGATGQHRRLHAL